MVSIDHNQISSLVASEQSNQQLIQAQTRDPLVGFPSIFGGRDPGLLPAIDMDDGYHCSNVVSVKRGTKAPARI